MEDPFHRSRIPLEAYTPRRRSRTPAVHLRTSFPGSLSFLKNGLEHFPAAFRGIVRTSSPALEDFDSIRVDGKWEVGIEHSEEFFVELRIRTQVAVTALRFGIIGLDDS